MRKFLLLAALTLLLVSCRDFRQRAERQMAKTLKETADPSAQLHDVKTVFCSDSLVILDGMLSGTGHFGKHIDMRVEYIYGMDDDGCIRDFVFNVDDRKSVITRAEEYRDSLRSNYDLERDSVQCIRDVAWIMDLAMNGREVK